MKLVFKIVNILVIVVSLVLLLNIKFIVHHMLKQVKIDDKITFNDISEGKSPISIRGSYIPQ